MCILFRCHAIEAVLTFYVVLQSFLCGSMWGVCEAQLCFKEPGNNCQGDTRETLGRHVPPLLFIFLLRDPSHLSSPSPLSRRPKDPLKGSTSQQPHRALTAAKPTLSPVSQKKIWEAWDVFESPSFSQWWLLYNENGEGKNANGHFLVLFEGCQSGAQKF